MDSEFCEVDFTTATLWENFTSKIEEIFYSWKLYQPEENLSCENSDSFSCEYGSWSIKTENIYFGGKEFNIFYYCRLMSQSKLDQKDGEKRNDTENLAEENGVPIDASGNFFPLDVNCLSKNTSKYGETEKLVKLIRLFDLQNFVLFVPTAESASVVSSESNVKFLISSFCMSAFNTRCFIPIFVQVFQLWQNCFVGVRVDEDGFRCDYQMIHLGKIPHKMHYFSGLVDMLKSKLSLTSYSDYIWASVKLSYCLSDFVTFAYPLLKKNENLEDHSDIEPSSFNLPFGAACEPIKEIRLHVAWPKVLENMVMDSENHSDFDPLNAPNWSVQVFSKDSRHLLSQHFVQFLKTCKSATNISELIGDLLKRKNFNVAGDLNVSTNLSISKIIAGGNSSGGNNSNANEIKRAKRYLPEETMVSMLYYLFPDADENNTFPFVSVSEDDNEDFLLKGMKTCDIGELPWRLSSIMCIIISNYGEYAAAQFWYEFIEELRFRWEKCLKLLGVQKGVPNHKTSLINQKLQMLNCCIQKRMKREHIDILSEDSDEKTSSCPSSGAPARHESEDEEFFDCQTETREYKDAFDFNIARVSLWNQPEGRLRKFNNLRLIETGDYMYIPITQEMTPKTEDQLEDDAVVLMKLGSDSEGSKLRARMMCASLYSDMESFKAANPGAILDDFIRWYSPRDWIESDEMDKYGQKKGKLSNRMLLPGNMWKEVWDTSIPVPAYRQKCLFDDRKESEKVLHFFESHKTLADVFTLLLPTLLHAALHTIIYDENVNTVRRYSSSLNEKINAVTQKAVSATRNLNLDLSQYWVLAEEIKEIEDTVTKYKSLELKLFPVDLSTEEDERKTLLELVLGTREIIVPYGPKCRLGRRIVFLFSKEHDEVLRGNLSEKNKKEESVTVHHETNDFFRNAAISVKDAITSHQFAENAHNKIMAPPYQKEFILHVTSAHPSFSSRINPHILTAHVCNEEILMATSFARDSIFV